jgi:hypothetical protein
MIENPAGQSLRLSCRANLSRRSGTKAEARAAAERLCFENLVSEVFRLFFFAAGIKCVACK